jgi:hypothetical protein
MSREGGVSESILSASPASDVTRAAYLRTNPTPLLCLLRPLVRQAALARRKP